MKIRRSSSTPTTPSRLGRRVALAMVVTVLTPLGACGNEDDAGSATTTTSATDTTLPVDTGSPTAGAGEDVFGWVESFETRDGTTIVQIDQAQMMTGDEAVAAAREDGVIGADEVLPNDYYIRNQDPSTAELTISPEVVVTLQACYPEGECVTTEQVDLATWSVLLGGEERPGLDWNWYGQGTLPNVFTMVNGLVVEIEEVYLP